MGKEPIPGDDGLKHLKHLPLILVAVLNNSPDLSEKMVWTKLKATVVLDGHESGQENMDDILDKSHHFRAGIERGDVDSQ